MFCPHSLGIGHAVIDFIMLVPFIGTLILCVKYKFKKGKKENE